MTTFSTFARGTDNWEITMTEKNKGFDRLMTIMRKLRAPGGCPWDAEQSHESLKRYLIEEAYEVIEAIDKNDREPLKEERGDLLLQPVFHVDELLHRVDRLVLASLVRARYCLCFCHFVLLAVWD
jgi:NTP pyrophosphatase (non-canonical NTP hydrolase)